MTGHAGFAWKGSLLAAAIVCAGLSPVHAGPSLRTESAATPGSPFQTLWIFKPQHQKLRPQGGVVVDSAGAIIGTRVAILPCSSECGDIYRLTPAAHGKWTFDSIHRFDANDGAPYASLTASGDTIYGVTASDGAVPNVAGMLFAMTPSGGGWRFTKLHGFDPTSAAGIDPLVGVTVDTDGTLYGLAQGGVGTKPPCRGIVYRFTPPHKYEIVHDFSNNTGDVSHGCDPQGEVVIGKDGALYGTTASGGDNNRGTIFRLTKTGDLTLLYSFVDGNEPSQRIAMAPSGTLYGTTQSGGANSNGTAWSLRPGPHNWKFTEISNFPQGGGNVYGIVRDRDGNLYGTIGGINNSTAAFPGGVLYRLSPPTSGSTWTFTDLHEFLYLDGAFPMTGPILNGSTLYGPTFTGGDSDGNCSDFYGCGTVYSYRLK